jgi:hypothetical protein
MLLESALFLHPNIASALVGQIAQSITSIAKREGNALKSLEKETFSSEQDSPDSIPNEIDGNGDDYDPWACSETSDCPTEPFEYECVNDRCSPVLPELVVDDATMRNVMAEQYGCWSQIGNQRWCKSVYPKIWPRVAYPEWTSTLGQGTEYERVVVNRTPKPNADLIRNGMAIIPESGTADSNVLTQGAIKRFLPTYQGERNWFGRVILDTIPLECEPKEDSGDWEYWIGGPITASGFITQGMKSNYYFKRVYDRGVGAKPHNFLDKVPSNWPQEEKEGVFGVAPLTEEYPLSRNSNDYGWGDWITSDWTNECGGSWILNRKAVVCCHVDCRCFFRMRYKATIVPSPTDTRFVNANKGQLSGAIYGENASAVGVQPHILKIAIEGQDTSGMFNSSFIPAAGDEYLIKIYRYGAPMQTQRVVADGTGKVLFAYAFPQEGLYQFTVDHVSSGNGCVVGNPSLGGGSSGSEFLQATSPYHINFGLFVNPPPPKRGCTKVGDLNYDSTAQIDDGSCADFNFGLGGGGDGNGSTGGGKGEVGGAIKRYVDENMTTTTGVALAALAFLGIVAVGSFGSKGEE